MAKAARKTEDNPIHFEPRRYVCSRWPFLRLRNNIKFDAGFYTAETEENARIVEDNEGFGQSIIQIKTKAKGKPSLEESAEFAALEQLKQLEPKVRRGMLGTRSQGE